MEDFLASLNEANVPKEDLYKTVRDLRLMVPYKIRSVKNQMTRVKEATKYSIETGKNAEHWFFYCDVTIPISQEFENSVESLLRAGTPLYITTYSLGKRKPGICISLYGKYWLILM